MIPGSLVSLGQYGIDTKSFMSYNTSYITKIWVITNIYNKNIVEILQFGNKICYVRPNTKMGKLALFPSLNDLIYGGSFKIGQGEVNEQLEKDFYKRLL